MPARAGIGRHTQPEAGLPARSERGFMLVEVLISALLVAIVVVGTLTGFDVVNRATANERHHSQAAGLAAQALEQLRSDPASTLSALYQNPYTYTKTLSKTAYEITQSAKPLGSGTGAGCNAGEGSKESAPSVLISASVTWPQQKASNAPPVVQSAVIAPPTGSSLEVDVTNGGSPAAGVPNITVLVTYTPAEAGVPNTLEATTNSGGCAFFSSIPSTKATVEIKEKPAFVTTSGALKYPSKEVSLAPNITTHYPVTYAEGGRIVAHFTYKGATEFIREGKREQVTGDTFTVYNKELTAEPKLQVGSASFGPVTNAGDYEAGGEERYKPRTGNGYFAARASTADATKYPNGDLFPFPTEWQVYAGDCKGNDAERITSSLAEKVKDAFAEVEPGKATEVSVPLSYVLLSVKSGTFSKPGATESTSYPIKITDSSSSCEGQPVANNASASNITHSQATSSEGHLTFPFQPFGSYELCLYNERNRNRYKASYSNTTTAGSSVAIYPEERPAAEFEKEEAETRTKREAKEAEIRKARETKEAEERATWQKELEKGKITWAKYGEKVKAQETARQTKESEEATKRKEAEAAEAATKTAREKVESERKYSIEGGQSSC